MSEFFDIVNSDVGFSLQKGACFCGQDQLLAGAGTWSPFNEFLCPVFALFIGWTHCADCVKNPVLHVWWKRDSSDGSLELNDFIA